MRVPTLNQEPSYKLTRPIAGPLNKNNFQGGFFYSPALCMYVGLEHARRC